MSEQAEEAMPSHVDPIAALRERLGRSRAALLEALASLTERDFASEIEEGRSVLDLLGELAPAELADAAAAEAGTAGGGDEASAGRRRDAMMAPQLVHELAGARRRTLLALDAIEAAGGGEGDPLAALSAVAGRQEQAAAAIRARFGDGVADS